MDYWIEDSEWRKFGSQRGPDDWDFYRDKFHFSRGALAKRELASYTHSNSYFRITTSLNNAEWWYIMGILDGIDVSHIEHLELSLRFSDKVDFEKLGVVLGSGRFSGLKTLRMGSTGGKENENLSESVAEALRRGCFTNLLTLSLHNCEVASIVASLNTGRITQLRSFSTTNSRIFWEKAFKFKFASVEIFYEILGNVCFKNLQHLHLEVSPFSREGRAVWWWIASGKLPNLRSLSLSGNVEPHLADLIPFFLRRSNPLENLIIVNSWISSEQVCDMVNVIVETPVPGLALRQLGLRKNGLDDKAVQALVHLVESDKLAQLRELDLSGNKGLNSETVLRLKKTILRGHLPKLRVWIWVARVKNAASEKQIKEIDIKTDSKAEEKDRQTTEAIARPDNINSLFSDLWVHAREHVPHLRYRTEVEQSSLEYTEGEQSSLEEGKRSCLEYSLRDIRLSDLEEKIELELPPHSPADCPPPTGSRVVLGADQVGFSAIPKLNLSSKIRLREIGDLRAALKSLGFSSLDTPFNHCTDSKLSIDTREDLDNLSRSILCQKLDAVFKSGRCKGLEHLELSGGVLDGIDGWNVLIQAIRSGHLESIRSMRLSQTALNKVDLADLAPLLLFSSFETLVLHGCWITSEQVCGLADTIMKGPETRLALKLLDLGDNQLKNRAVKALVNLAHSDFLPQLEQLDLSMNKGLGSTELVTLMETIQRGYLPSLDSINWKRNAVNNDAARALVITYYEGFTVAFHGDWNQVKDLLLETKAEEYRNRNMRLKALRVKHKEELEEEVPLMWAKVFLGGYPEVGKTTLRRALTQGVLETHPLKEARTRGIELSYLEGRNVTFTLWDLAGHDEYHVLHGTFFPDLGLAGGKATTFVLVFRASFERGVEGVEKDLLYWLRFAASSSQKFVRRHVVIVLNCFEGKQCTEGDKRLWMALLRNFQEMFKDVLDIRPDPFVMDVRLPTVVEQLKNHLFEKTEILLRNVMVPKVCFELQEKLKRWSQSERNSRLPIMSWEVFEVHLNLNHTTQQSSGKDFKIAALYLHEMGGIIYLDNYKSSESGSERRSVVVLDPDWFCSKVVGELLVPEEWLEGKSPLRVKKDGSIARHLFEAYFKDLLVQGTQSDDVILMLERVGLCSKKNANQIIVPGLIQQDDPRVMDWEDEGFHMVMGRRLAVEDHERSAIPVTLFRRLQVDLAKDLKFGGRGDSDYRAGKSFSSLKVGALLLLIQFNVDHSDPSNDRIDILVKSVIREDPANASLAQVECICEILGKLEKLCVACCPGLKYDIKAIKPWSATDRRTPEMLERETMSLREIKVLLIENEQYSGWQVNGIPVELTTFLSENKLEKIQEVKRDWRLEMGEVTDELNVSLKAGEETDALDYWCSSEVSEGSEDCGDFSEDGVELRENLDVSMEALGEIGEPDSVSTPLTTATSSPKSFASPLQQLDDMIFEVYTPAHLETPELEVVFFYGLQLKYQRDTYVSTWMTRDNSQLWLRTLLVPEFPGSRILIVSYDSSPRKTYTNGLMDMFVIAENLLSSVTSDKVKLGQSGRPVVLVGHCLGGLVVKEFCLQAAAKLNLMKEGSLERKKIKTLVDSIKGMFFYATAHSGSPMVDLLHKYIQAEGLLLDQMEILNTNCARRNMAFEQLRQCRQWLIHVVGESRNTYLEFLGESVLVVPEASARYGMDSFLTADADHFDVCKPANSSSSSLRFLAGFLQQIRDADLRQGGVVRSPDG